MSTCFSTANIYRSYYEPESSLHVMRMPSYIHDTLIGLLQASIELQLDKFRASDNAKLASFTNDILNCGSANLRLEDGSRHQPDLQLVLLVVADIDTGI